MRIEVILHSSGKWISSVALWLACVVTTSSAIAQGNFKLEVNGAPAGKSQVIKWPHSVTNVTLSTQLKTIKGRYEPNCVLEEKEVKLIVAFAVGKEQIQQLGNGTLSGYVPIPDDAGLGYSQKLSKIDTVHLKEKLGEEILERNVDGKMRKVRVSKWRVYIHSSLSFRTSILSRGEIRAGVALELGILEAKGKTADTKIEPMYGAVYANAYMLEETKDLVFEEVLDDVGDPNRPK